jgi:LemA protein
VPARQRCPHRARAERGQAEGMLSGALKSLFALSEAYPDLKAAGNFQELQGTLANLEEALQSARRYYNAVVRDYNTKIHSVPSNILAQSFNFAEKDFFEIPEAEKTAPKVDFSDGSNG